MCNDFTAWYGTKLDWLFSVYVDISLLYILNAVCVQEYRRCICYILFLFMVCLNEKVVEFCTSRLPLGVHVHQYSVFPSKGCVVQYTANSCLLQLENISFCSDVTSYCFKRGKICQNSLLLHSWHQMNSECSSSCFTQFSLGTSS